MTLERAFAFSVLVAAGWAADKWLYPRLGAPRVIAWLLFAGVGILVWLVMNAGLR